MLTEAIVQHAICAKQDLPAIVIRERLVERKQLNRLLPSSNAVRTAVTQQHTAPLSADHLRERQVEETAACSPVGCECKSQKASLYVER